MHIAPVGGGQKTGDKKSGDKMAGTKNHAAFSKCKAMLNLKLTLKVEA